MNPISSDATDIPTLERPATIETLKDFHQFYRDALSQPVALPDIGSYPLDLITWVIDPRNVDVPQLIEIIDMLPASGLSAEHQLALRMALFTILQANLASDHNNNFPNHTLPPDIVVNIKRGLSRVLELHPTADYIALSVQLLYRVKEIEEVISLAESYPDIFARYPILQAIIGFIHTMLGNHEQAVSYLDPVARTLDDRSLMVTSLSLMTSQYFLGQTPDWPLCFASLGQTPDALEQLIGQLPAFEMVQALQATSRPVVFIACDTGYFMEHARHLAYSLHATNVGKLDLHLHLYFPAPEVFDEVERLRERLPGLAIGVSIEQGPAPTSNLYAYYATARFVRAYQVLQHYRCALCMMDADALFNGDWDEFMHSLPTETELVLATTDAAPFWERILGGFAYCRPTPHAERFLSRVAGFIAHNIVQDKLVWFTDQVALSACADRDARENAPTYHIDYRKVIDLKHTSQSLCWMVTTKKTGNREYDEARARLERRYASA